LQSTLLGLFAYCLSYRVCYTDINTVLFVESRVDDDDV